MMQIWIVWDREPVASFSSQARALQFIASQPDSGRWQCVPTELNPETVFADESSTRKTTPTARTVTRLNH